MSIEDASIVERIRNMPDQAMVPAWMVKEAFDQYDREAILLAAREEATIQMYCHLATEHLCERPTGYEDPTGVDEWQTSQRGEDPHRRTEPATNGRADRESRGPTPPGRRV